MLAGNGIQVIILSISGLPVTADVATNTSTTQHVEQCEEIQTENVYKEYSAIQLVDNWEWRQYKQASCLRKKL